MATAQKYYADVDFNGNKILNLAGITDASGNKLVAAPLYELGNWTQLGTVIADTGGPLGGNNAVGPAVVFDGNINTFYDAQIGANGAYVGRDLGVAKPVNQITLMPRQDNTYASQINGAVVQYSTNLTTWTTCYTVSGVNSANKSTLITVSMGYVTARYWRLFGAAYGNVSEMTIASVEPTTGNYVLLPATDAILGGIRVGTGLSMNNGVLSVVATGGGSAYSNTTLTQAAIQALIDNAAANTQINLAPGDYPFTSGLLIQNKAGLTLNGNGQVRFIGATNNFVYLNGVINRLRVTGIQFISTINNTTEQDSMFTSGQTVEGGNLEIDHCYFTAAGGNFNAIGWVPVDQNPAAATNNRIFSGIDIHDNVIENIGRCGIELLNQKLDVYRVLGLTIRNNVIRNCGLNNQYGMGVSLSGAFDGYLVSSNKIYESKYYSIEIINSKNGIIANNTIRSTVSGCAGISVNSQPGPDGGVLANELVTIVGNDVITRYSPIQVTDVSYVNVHANNLTNANTSDISNGGVRFVACKFGQFIGNIVKSSSYNALTLNSCFGWQVNGNFLSNKAQASGASYQIVWLYGNNCVTNEIRDNTYEKNPNLADLQNFVFESDGATNNIWSDAKAGQGLRGTNGTRYWLRTDGTVVTVFPNAF